MGRAFLGRAVVMMSVSWGGGDYSIELGEYVGIPSRRITLDKAFQC